MVENIRIVLVNTSHPGNIGAAARAMKTMGLEALYLVSPQLFPHPKATEMATGASDVLENAIRVETLAEAIADCHLIVGTSARSRTIPWPMLSPREFAEKAIQEAGTAKVAVIFGREQSGLTNEELHCCHFHLQIPCNPTYTSLNIAAAVQVIAYELRMASLEEGKTQAEWDYPFATAAEAQGFYEHLERMLIAVDFLNPKVPRQLMTRLKRLFHRARPDTMEINILRGILGAIDKKYNRP
ncbi:MAG: trmJ [Gammaproteobacteria bacterium]|jgi:tRNA (cytidine32/uridine32-2'-O)-methyltransferase|nr:trmJ [Gammaproteobacteria bacterium]